MVAVLEVITTLEKAYITKEALEKTRLGKYINELRKRTNNEQLARRAKELVKSWRKLLPQVPQRVNGEEILNSISSPGSLTVLGPGPGPGFGPGPGPGNRIIKSVSVPGTPRYRTLSPSMMGERSSSPYFSSASNSPLLNSVHQGSSLPSNYAPVKFSQCHVTTRGEKSNSVTKSSLLNSSNQSKNVTSQTFKPISPTFVKQVSNTLSIETNMGSQTNCSPNISPRTETNSGSNSPVFVTLTVCPTLSSSVAHSTLDIAKTNVANKRLRKEMSALTSTQDDYINFNSELKIGNGMSDLAEDILSSESSAFKKVNSLNSDIADDLDIVTNSRTPKRKRSLDKQELPENRLGDMLASLPSGSKHPKVKTTQQLIADLESKKGEDSLLPDSTSNHDTDVSRTKSEMLQKFLNSQSTRQENNQESPTGESSVSAISDYGSFSVPDVSSVINTNLNSAKTQCDPVDEEINRILSALPPINTAEINLEDDDSPCTRSSNLNENLYKLSEPWEYVNGVFDCNGTWRPWQECSEQKSVGESFLILPYVNID